MLPARLCPIASRMFGLDRMSHSEPKLANMRKHDSGAQVQNATPQRRAQLCTTALVAEPIKHRDYQVARRCACYHDDAQSLAPHVAVAVAPFRRTHALAQPCMIIHGSAQPVAVAIAPEGADRCTHARNHSLRI